MKTKRAIKKRNEEILYLIHQMQACKNKTEELQLDSSLTSIVRSLKVLVDEYQDILKEQEISK